MSRYSKRKLFKKILKEFKKNFIVILLGFLLIVAAFLLGILFDRVSLLQSEGVSAKIAENNSKELEEIQSKVIKEKYVFNIKWGDLGKRMVEDGVIDKTKLAQAISGTDQLPKDLDKYFNSDQKQIEINSSNAQFWVDVLWGLGLSNKNRILEEGDMMADGNASGFASTGGWTLGAGDDPMVYYSNSSYINLSEEQQKTVEEIAGNIYRPCCGNSTAFPDCNHGMAMLGLIELMVSQGKSRDEIYKTALAFNTYWFPSTYLEAALYLEKTGEDYAEISPKELLSTKFSSAMRDQAISEETRGAAWPILGGDGGSCGA